MKIRSRHVVRKNGRPGSDHIRIIVAQRGVREVQIYTSERMNTFFVGWWPELGWVKVTFAWHSKVFYSTDACGAQQLYFALKSFGNSCGVRTRCSGLVAVRILSPL